MRPRPVRHVRDPVDGRILSIRPASDPYWDTEFLRDPLVRLFFASLDRAKDEADGNAHARAAEVLARYRSAVEELRAGADRVLRQLTREVKP